MSGTKFPFDTDFIIGLLKLDPAVLAEVSTRTVAIADCSYSAITRMELLGFPGISRDEESIIRQKLERLRYLPLTRAIEDVAISLRQARKISGQMP